MFQRRTSGTHAHAQSWLRRTVKALGRWVGRGGGGGGHGRRHHNLIAYDGLSSNTSNGLPWIKVPFACITSLRVDAHLPNPWNAMWEGVTRPGCSQQLPRSLRPRFLLPSGWADRHRCWRRFVLGRECPSAWRSFCGSVMLVSKSMIQILLNLPRSLRPSWKKRLRTHPSTYLPMIEL